MKITIEVPDRYVDILSKFASVGRTFDNTENCLNEFALMTDDPAWKDRAYIARDEIEILHRPLEELHVTVRNEIWKLRSETK